MTAGILPVSGPMIPRKSPILIVSLTEHAAEEHKLYCLGPLNDKEQLGIVLKSSEENGHFLRIGFFYSTNMKFNEADERDLTII